MSTQHTTQAEPVISTQLRAETMAYALQSGVYNLAANFFEPYINYHIQKRYSGTDALHPGTHGSYGQNLLGEFAGDLTGAGSLILAEAMFPTQLHLVTSSARRLVDPLYNSVAHMVFAKEAGTPGYEEKIAQWRLFQERNLVRSSIIATTGIAGNIAAQKWLIGNPSPTGLIFKGKLVSTALTTALGLTARFAFPTKMKAMDKLVASHVFAPLLEDKAMPESYSQALTNGKPAGELPSPSR